MAYRMAALPRGGDVGAWAEGELRKVEEAFLDVSDFVSLRELTAAPRKPRNGMIVYADGTNWNPGSGRGVYLFKGSSWAYLG